MAEEVWDVDTRDRAERPNSRYYNLQDFLKHYSRLVAEMVGV